MIREITGTGAGNGPYICIHDGVQGPEEFAVSCLDLIESSWTLIPTLHLMVRITPSPLVLMGAVILGLLRHVIGLQGWMPGNWPAASHCLVSLMWCVPVKQLLVSH
jgi:hypothetical protein